VWNEIGKGERALVYVDSRPLIAIEGGETLERKSGLAVALMTKGGAGQEPASGTSLMCGGVKKERWP